jgi:hypothetical protein
MKKLMIITLGTGQGVEHGLAKSIVVNNPDGLILIVTQESLAQQMSDKLTQVVKDVYHQPMPRIYEFPTVVYHEADVKEVYQATVEAITLARQHGYASEQIYLDFTSGTKAMSVGAALAAFLNGCRTMVYIGGFQRDATTGRVVSGSEIVMTFTLQNLFEQTTPPATDAETVFRIAPKEINL